MASKESLEFETKHIAVGNYELQARSDANDDRPVVILLHGIGVSEKYFRPLARELSSRYRVISLNLPGYGETKRPARALNLDELAEVVAMYILQENIIRPIIIGQSMGCQIAVRLSIKTDIQVRKLVLISPTVNRQERSAPTQFFRLLQDSLREPLSVNRILIADYLRFGFRRYLQTQHAMINDSIETILEACKLPVLVVRGERDKIVPSNWAEFLGSTLEDGALVEVKCGPHNLQYTHPKEVAKLCADFIGQ